MRDLSVDENYCGQEGDKSHCGRELLWTRILRDIAFDGGENSYHERGLLWWWDFDMMMGIL